MTSDRGNNLGQKTHPLGFRLPVNKSWRSNWYAGANFPSELEEDVQIRKYLKHRLPNAGISRVEIGRTSRVVTVTVFTARPGIVIGKGGEEVTRLKAEVAQLTEKEVQMVDLKLQEVKSLLKEEFLYIHCVQILNMR